MERQAVGQDAVVRAEAVVVDVGQVRQVGDLGVAAEPCHREGEVKADGIGRHLVAKRGEFLREPMGLDVADRGIERRHHVEETRLAAGVAQLDQGQSRADAGEVRGGIARLQLGADQIDRVPLPRDSAYSRLGCGHES